jgi:hypothetical protein
MPHKEAEMSEPRNMQDIQAIVKESFLVIQIVRTALSEDFPVLRDLLDQHYHTFHDSRFTSTIIDTMADIGPDYGIDPSRIHALLPLIACHRPLGAPLKVT